MPSERIQRRIDSLLDEADDAVARDDWETVRQRAGAALRFDKENADALAYLEAARTDAPPPVEASAPVAVPTPAAPPQPERFAGDRYEVLRHLGDGGTKRVFLVRDTRLDREVALALVRTEGLDATGRERVARGAGPERSVEDAGEIRSLWFVI